jgi:peptidoglycan/xylan/chitin deacetylase (PgdA/CDA1 family)
MTGRLSRWQVVELRATARSARAAVLSIADSLGLFRLVGDSTWRRRRLLIICYHGVSLTDEHLWHDGLFVTPAFLRRRFEILMHEKCNVLDLGKAAELLRDGKLPERSVVLTFDDGFYDFYAAAAPLLSEFGFPATVYVSTYHCVNQRALLSLTIRYFLWKARAAPEQAVSLLTEANSLAHNRPAQQAWLEDLAKKLQIDWDAFCASRIMHLMNQTELTDLAQRGFDIQLHTHRHRTPADPISFKSEIVENKAIIERCTGKPATHFCYPSGLTNPQFLPWLAESNILTATTCDPELAHRATDRLMLPRFVDTMGQSEVTFRGWLTGIAQLTSRARVPTVAGD